MGHTPLSDRVAIITGAGQGIGRGIALAAAKAGAKVVVAEINDTTAADTVRLIQEAGGTAIAIHTDIMDAVSIDDCITETVARFGGINILVNNAIKTTPNVPLAEMTDEVFVQSLESGVIATMRFTRGAYPHLDKAATDASSTCVAVPNSPDSPDSAPTSPPKPGSQASPASPQRNGATTLSPSTRPCRSP